MLFIENQVLGGLEDQNRLNMEQTLRVMRAELEKCTSENTHAAMFAAAINSGSEHRLAGIGHTGGYDQVAWVLLANMVVKQPALPVWRKRVIWWLMTLPVWKISIFNVYRKFISWRDG